jgi:hypothetical protein
MNITTITHIHLKKEATTVQIYLVDEQAGTEERITLRPDEMQMPLTLSRAIVFVQTQFVSLLVKAQIVDSTISSEIDGITSLLLAKEIHKFFDKGDEAWFKLNTPVTQVIRH